MYKRKELPEVFRNDEYGSVRMIAQTFCLPEEDLESYCAMGTVRKIEVYLPNSNAYKCYNLKDIQDIKQKNCI